MTPQNNPIVEVNKRRSWLEETIDKLFYDKEETVYVTVSVDKDSESSDGYRSDAEYTNTVGLPGKELVEQVAAMQEAMKKSLEKDPLNNHAEAEGTYFKKSFDPLGIKRLMRYITR